MAYMFIYASRRILAMIPILLFVSMAIFGLIQLQPGDFIDELRLANPRMTTADVERLRREYGLDQPWYVQYGKWLSRAVRLDFGLSRENGYVSATEYVFEQRLGNTVTLSSTAFLIALLIGIPVGIFAAVRQYSFLDYATTFLSFVGFSVPVFWLGIMMLILFGVTLKIFPTGGMQSDDVTQYVESVEKFTATGQVKKLEQKNGQYVLTLAVYDQASQAEVNRDVTLPVGILPNVVVEDYVSEGQALGQKVTFASWWAWFLDRLHHIVLPAIALSIISIAGWTRFMRASLLEVINQDFVRTARAKGLSERIVIYKHALRNALIPIVTLVGLSIPGILNGAVLTETVFNWPGMGTALLDSVVKKDYNVAMVILMMLAIVTLVANLLTDLAYGLVDPRIRYN
jgi:peptide/nickel transport system permease protein